MNTLLLSSTTTLLPSSNGCNLRRAAKKRRLARHTSSEGGYSCCMNPSPLATLLVNLRDRKFRDLAGARVSGSIPISERLLNEIVAATMPKNLPVRDVSVRPEQGNRFSVRISPKAAFLPQLTVKLEIEKQPQFPTSPELVLRMATMGGLLGLAGAAFPIASMLPPGVRLEGERIILDLRALAHREGVVDLLELVRELEITTEEGRMRVFVDTSVA
jgi:hypothetical protein